jgi:hypothetical protein
MKKIIYLLIMFFMLLSCRAYLPVAQQSGKDDIGYLLFVSSDKYADKDIRFAIDNMQPYTAKVIKDNKSRTKGTQYGIATGTHVLEITYNGKKIYEKKIFISTQEVKRITLP